MKEIKGFKRPFCVQQNAKGEIYVGDFGSGIVSIYDPELSKIKILSASFGGPHSISFDAAGSFYVCEYYAKKVSQFLADGTFLKTVLDNAVTPTLLSGPAQMRIAPNGNLVVSDYGSSTIQVFSPDGEFIRKIGSNFDRCHSTAFDDRNNLYVADTWNNQIKKFDEHGNFLEILPGEFSIPVSIDFNEGRFVISENGTSTVQCYSYDWKFLWMRGGYNHPYDVKLKGNILLVADADNHRVTLEEV